MTNEDRKPIVKQLLAEGRTLSEIQDFLQKQKGDSITYMELRLLLSEMPDAKLPEKETPKATPFNMGAASAPRPGPASTPAPAPAAGTAKLSISVDQMPQPGAM